MEEDKEPYRKTPFRVAIIGPESSGKTTLAIKLAQYFDGEWVPEYARSYLSELGRPYTFEDVLFIAQKQYALEQESVSRTSHKIIFSDTELLVIKVWFEHKYGQCPAWISEYLSRQKFDLYLLLYPDIPWVQDGFREYEDDSERRLLYAMYLAELQNYRFNFVEIHGDFQDRFTRSVDEILKYRADGNYLSE